MTVRFVTDLVVLAVMVGAGWWAHGWLHPPVPPDPMPAPDGYELEVVEVNGRTLWQRFRSRETRDEMAGSWCFADYVVLTKDPGQRGMTVVWGRELLDEWESMWPLDSRGR